MVISNFGSNDPQTNRVETLFVLIYHSVHLILFIKRFIANTENLDTYRFIDTFELES